MRNHSAIITVLLVLTFVLASFAADKLTISPLPQQTDGVQINKTATEKLAFHGATPVVMRAGAAQAVVSTNALTVSGNYTEAEVTALATRASALTVLVNEIRAALVEKGIIKGAAN